jgi:quercetin dioxygenase-like cupin family protein
MLKGKIEFHLGTEQRVCGPGDVVVIPEGSEYEAWFREDTGDSIFSASCATTFYLAARPPT